MTRFNMATTMDEKKTVPAEDEKDQESETKEETEEEQVVEDSESDEFDDIPRGPGRSFLRDLLSETIIGKLTYDSLDQTRKVEFQLF